MPADEVLRAALERAAQAAAVQLDPRVRWVRNGSTYWDLSDLCPEEHDVCSYSCIEGADGRRVYHHLIGVAPPPPLPLEQRFG